MVLLPIKHQTNGKVLIKIDLWVFTTEYETLLLIKEIKICTTISPEAEKGLVFHLEHQLKYPFLPATLVLFVCGRT